MMPWHVYTLTDPRTGRVRYVGSTFTLAKRFQEHISLKNVGKDRKSLWIAELRALGLVPVCDAHESGSGDRLACESRWIAYYAAAGADLTNVRGMKDGAPQPLKGREVWGPETLLTIAALTVAPDNYPAPVDVAAKLGISRQALYQRLNALEGAGLIERRNHGHALKVLPVEARP